MEAFDCRLVTYRSAFWLALRPHFVFGLQRFVGVEVSSLLSASVSPDTVHILHFDEAFTVNVGRAGRAERCRTQTQGSYRLPSL